MIAAVAAPGAPAESARDPGREGELPCSYVRSGQCWELPFSCQ